MKTILIVTAVLYFSLISCDKRKDLFWETNNGPVTALTLENVHSSYSHTKINDSTYIDTLKLGSYYRFKIDLSDENASMDFSFVGDGQLYKNGSLFNGASSIENGVHSFEWLPDTTGSQTFKIAFTDVYGARKSYQFTINVFINRVPTLSWILESVGNLSPLEKRIVLNAHDGDEVYGGQILYYEYVINSDTTLYPGSTFYYVFPEQGSYLISVRAIDSNLEWSDAVTIDPYLIVP